MATIPEARRALDHFGAESLLQLSQALFEIAPRSNAPTAMMALSCIFRFFAQHLDDRPTSTQETDNLFERIRPLLEMLDESPGQIEIAKVDAEIQSLTDLLFI